MPEAERGGDVVVWARRGVAVRECPRSFVGADSVAMVERFFVWQADGVRLRLSMRAREAEAMLLLKQELEKEKRDDNKRGTD